MKPRLRNYKKEIPAGLYVAVTEEFCLNGSSIETLKQVLAGGAKIIQLREKKYSKNKILKMAKTYRSFTKKSGALLIVNDYPDIALKAGADGVHLGPEDMTVAEAREKAPGLIIGASAYSVKEAAELEKQGADYINIGPVFATKTKKLDVKPVGLTGIRKTAKILTKPFTVMGGIKEKHIKPVIRAGAKRIAVITEVTMAKDVARKVKRLRRLSGEKV